MLLAGHYASLAVTALSVGPLGVSVSVGPSYVQSSSSSHVNSCGSTPIGAVQRAVQGTVRHSRAVLCTATRTAVQKMRLNSGWPFTWSIM